MSMTAYIDERYDDTFDSVYSVLHDLGEQHPEQTVRHIRQTLKSLYIRQGNDWTGREAIGNTSLDASVAAHEAVLAELAIRSTSREKE